MNYKRETYYLYQYRILVFLLFRDQDYVTFNPETRHLKINKLSAFSNDVGYRSHKVRQGLVHLQKLNLIYDLQLAYNKASFYLARPNKQ